ncbi:MAG: nitronate monooxygenase [Candidatus Hydrogenedentes bacterium]|nr:nitronate monooxygenase [Candidatus Hydrogenedentota bacterium]
MGAAVSNWLLAKAVSMRGQLGVVSGTALATVVGRKLQAGDPGGHVRRALATFPVPEIAERILKDWYRPARGPANTPFKLHSMYTLNPSQDLLELTVTSSYSEVYLAKEGHDGVVGINLLEKIRLPNPSTLFGAMLAGVDYVLMGAGIPMEIPGLLDGLSRHEPVRLNVHVEGASPGDEHVTVFDPRRIMSEPMKALKRPLFLAIIASAVLAAALVKKATGRVDGFVIEGPTAGGHNAPPRGQNALSPSGEPVYGPKDVVDLNAIKAHGRPFWLAGSYGTPERVKEALELGAEGVQVGTAFAFCEESGFTPEIKQAALERVAAGDMNVFTDPLASPTGFPFKVASVPDTLAEQGLYAERPRICDLGFLRQAYKKENGSVGFRCPAEPVDQYLKKGGKEEDTSGRKCLCNALSAAVGCPQTQKTGNTELPIITAGDDLKDLGRFLRPGCLSYSAEDVLNYLLQGVTGELALAPQMA